MISLVFKNASVFLIHLEQPIVLFFENKNTRSIRPPTLAENKTDLKNLISPTYKKSVTLSLNDLGVDSTEPDEQ